MCAKRQLANRWLSMDATLLLDALQFIVAGLILWPLCGLTAYVTAALYDRLTGMGSLIPHSVLVEQRHWRMWSKSGPIVLLEMLSALPFMSYLHAKGGCLYLVPSDSSPAGVVLAARPAGQHQGWYLFKYVPGTETRKEARIRSAEATWISANAVAATDTRGIREVISEHEDAA